ncbi:MAG: BamA/TamA family outer membrane protein [Candidatus Coatesbacteria bacterium]|nr:BamA/TamA family outer membrane protein [Candidatus Coatesbacteria bacterium]
MGKFKIHLILIISGILVFNTISEARIDYYFDKFVFFSALNEKTKIDERDYKENKEFTSILGFRTGIKISQLEFQRGTARLEKYFKDQGFLDVKIVWKTKDDHTLKKRIVMITIYTGLRYTIKNIEIQGNKEFSTDKIMEALELKQGNNFDRNLIVTSIEKVKKLYGEEGYINIKATFESWIDDKTNRQGSIKITFNEGLKHRIEDIKILGNSKVRDRIINREIPFKKGDYLNLTTMYEVQKNIYRLGLFKDIEFIPEQVPDKPGWVIVIIRVTEDKFNFVRFNFGLGPYFDAFNIDATWGNSNLGGNNQQISLGNYFYYRIGLNEDRHFYRERPNISYTEPWFGGYSFSFRGEIYYQVEQIYWNRYLWGEKIRFYKQFNLKKDMIYIEHNYEQRKTSVDTLDEDIKDKIPQYIKDETAGRRVKNSLTPGYEWDHRLDPFYPLSGYFSQISFTFAGGLLGGDDFYKLIFSFARYNKLFKNTAFCWHVYAGYSSVYGDETSSIPSDDLFFAGGANTYRGEDALQMGPKDSNNNALGGKLLSLGNIEIRYPLFWKIGGVFFIDVGQLWGKYQDVNLSSIRYSYGLGFSYKTSIGPIRLEYGVDTKEANHLTKGSYHIAFGQSF